mmetsp:Transcript_11590/g.46842  ORF Transcript_11590/g.46842 Transcript_11590/m.46842 type:complete len:335 (+) Transcript_11590:849-1853(+)
MEAVRRRLQAATCTLDLSTETVDGVIAGPVECSQNVAHLANGVLVCAGLHLRRVVQGQRVPHVLVTLCEVDCHLHGDLAAAGDVVEEGASIHLIVQQLNLLVVPNRNTLLAVERLEEVWNCGLHTSEPDVAHSQTHREELDEHRSGEVAIAEALKGDVDRRKDRRRVVDRRRRHHRGLGHRRLALAAVEVVRPGHQEVRALSLHSAERTEHHPHAVPAIHDLLCRNDEVSSRTTVEGNGHDDLLVGVRDHRGHGRLRLTHLLEVSERDLACSEASNLVVDTVDAEEERLVELEVELHSEGLGELWVEAHRHYLRSASLHPPALCIQLVHHAHWR